MTTKKPIPHSTTPWPKGTPLPMCQIPYCKNRARYDGKTRNGPWGYLCNTHFKSMGVGLGLGKGQKLIASE